MKQLLLVTALSSAVALAGAPALAQDAPAPAVKSAPAQKQRQARMPSERIEARLDQLKTTLKITDAQQPQWNAFADTLRKQARAADERMKSRRSQAGKGAKPDSMNAIQRLEQRKAFLAAATARTDELLASAKPLYAALSPEQQKIADDLIAKRGDRRARHRDDDQQKGPRGRG